MPDPEGPELGFGALEAFADTLIPGEKRGPSDRAVAGVSRGGGAVASGVIEVLLTPEGGWLRRWGIWRGCWMSMRCGSVRGGGGRGGW